MTCRKDEIPATMLSLTDFLSILLKAYNIKSCYFIISYVKISCSTSRDDHLYIYSTVESIALHNPLSSRPEKYWQSDNKSWKKGDLWRKIKRFKFPQLDETTNTAIKQPCRSTKPEQIGLQPARSCALLVVALTRWLPPYPVRLTTGGKA